MKSRGSVDIARLGPQPEIIYGPREDESTPEEIVAHAQKILNLVRSVMHYRNGREAKNGDKIVGIHNNGTICSIGILYDAQPGNDYCNGSIAPISPDVTGACLVDCLHMDDVAAMLKEKGLDKRPEGK